MPVPSALLGTPRALWPGATESVRASRAWLRVLLAGRARPLVADRALLGAPLALTATSPVLTADPRRVPVARLRRFFFDRVEPYADGSIARASDLSQEARSLLNAANPWTRERALHIDFQCDDADAVALRVDLCCTTWERTVLHALGNTEGSIVPQFTNVMVPLVARVCALEPADRPSYWRGVALPRVAIKEPDEDLVTYARRLCESGLALWAIAMWRVAAARVLEDALDLRGADDGMPTPQSVLHDELSYDFRLVRDMQLDLLAYAARTGRFSDEAMATSLLDGDGTGAAVYPDALHVLCIEEMPDMSAVLALVNIWYDSGIRKTRESVIEALAHVFCKMMNQKCQIRDLRKLVLDYSDRYPGFNRLFKLLLQISLLGNLPRAEAPLDWAARIRVSCMFRGEYRGPSTPLSRSFFAPWMRTSIYSLMFLIREVLVHTVDRDSVLAEVMEENMHWHQHTRIVRAANGDMRRVLSHQAAWRPGHHFDWTQLQRTEPNSNGKPKKVGITMRYHDAGLKANNKMRKAPFEAIILKEMTSCHTFYGSRIAFDEAAALAELARIDEALHLCAWDAAREKGPIMPTRWLPVIGMSNEGYERVRRWKFEYYVYDVSDHGYVDELYALHAHDPLDWVRLRAYAIRFMQFKDEGNVFFLPVQRVRTQLRALRENALIDPGDDTPAHLGVAMRCPECDTWATPVVEPPVTINADGEGTSAAHAGVKRRVVTAANKDSAPDPDGTLSEDDEDSVLEPDDEEADALATVAELQREEQRKKATERLEKRVAQSMYMSAVWYDPISGKLQCRRRHRSGADALAGIYAQLDALEASDGESDGDEEGDESRVAHKSAPAVAGAGDDDGMEDDAEGVEVRDMRVLMNAATLATANRAALSRIAALAERAAHEMRGTGTGAVAPEPGDTKRATARRTDPVDAYLVRHFHREHNRVLTPVDQVGVWVTTRSGVFGLCDICGLQTRIENNRVCNEGISCLHHLTSNMRADNPVRLLLEARNRRRAGLKPLKPGEAAARDTLLLARPLGHRPCAVRNAAGTLVMCFHCTRHVAEYQVLCYDRTVQLWRVPLCQMHYKASQRTLQSDPVPSVTTLLGALVATRW